MHVTKMGFFACLVMLFLSINGSQANGQSSPDDKFVNALKASSKDNVNKINSIDVTTKLSIDFGKDRYVRASSSRLRIEGNKMRADTTMRVQSLLGDGSIRMVDHTTTDAFNGEVTKNLPASTPVFTITNGNAVAEYQSLLPGYYAHGDRIDQWLEKLSLSHQGESSVNGEKMHSFTGIKPLPPGAAGKPRLRRYEIQAAENKNYAIQSVKLYDENNLLLSQFEALEWKKLENGVWMPSKTRTTFFDAQGNPSRTDLSSSTFNSVNLDLDDDIFELAAPPDYTIVDNTKGIAINPSDLRVDPMAAVDDTQNLDETSASDSSANNTTRQTDSLNSAKNNASNKPDLADSRSSYKTFSIALSIIAIIVILILVILSARKKRDK